MKGKFDELIGAAERRNEQALDLLQKLTAVAKVDSVFGEPVAQGNYTVITASEGSVALGFGHGLGGANAEAEAAGAAEGETPDSGREQSAGGGGGGGGGAAHARPVAVIGIGPDGVTISPVLDRTKLGLAALTTLGTMLMMLGRMRAGK